MPAVQGTQSPALLRRLDGAFSRIPHWLIALVGRIAIAGTFWRAGQTKVQGFAIDVVEGRFELGMPRFADSTVELFRDEYRLPVLSPALAAMLTTVAEHVFPALILVGLATRLSAFALLVVTIVIQIFVYPGAWPLHFTWIAVLLYLMARGAGALSLDAWLGRNLR